MRWKQFFTPVESLDARHGQEMALRFSADEMTILDVRQAKEYNAGHLPGAKLIPLPELDERIDELDPSKKILVY
jgi:rhodanese-related sulfurtransferase